MTELSDEKIMLRVKEGYLSELSELFERYHEKLYNFFLRLTFDPAASEDLTQNLFYRIIRYRHTFEGTAGTYRSWMYQMARNVHIDFRRQQRKYSDRFSMNGEELPDLFPGNEDAYNEEDFQRLDQALRQLQPDQREVLVLSRFQGLKYGEISKIRNSSVAAVKVQVYRAIRQLRSLYFKQQQEEGI
ncbi:MAG TPA: RNA polymerase sigma factor [Puia sp.]